MWVMNPRRSQPTQRGIAEFSRIFVKKKKLYPCTVLYKDDNHYNHHRQQCLAYWSIQTLIMVNVLGFSLITADHTNRVNQEGDGVCAHVTT
jgi:hypothetical protein